MKLKIVILFLALAGLCAAGCSSADKGSREFIPGKGWVPVSS